MDLKKPENKKELANKVSDLFSEYQSLFDILISDPSNYKKAALWYYWLRDYKNYVKNESTFSPKYYPDFRRGSLVNLNLGFNIGSEMGGLHYAIVLRDSKRKDPNLVVMPLTSLKPNKDITKLRPTDVYLGEELYYKIQGKYEALRVSIPNEIELLRKSISSISSKEDNDKILLKLQDLEKRIELLKKARIKLSVLKHGSIVVANQIRTVSKIRLIDPRDKYDILYGLSLSTSSLNKIDQKLVELYTHTPT